MSPTGFSVILVPFDHGATPYEALRVAQSLARPSARVIVARVGGASETEAMGPSVPGVQVETVVRPGPAVETLLALATELGAEVIILADDRVGASQGLPNGTLAQEVLRRASCPVVCLPCPSELDSHPIPPLNGPIPSGLDAFLRVD